MSKVAPQTPKGAWYRALELSLRPLVNAITKKDWQGGHYLQEPGGVVLAMNHLSWFDPLASAHFVNDHGRPARFLAKAELFKVPLFGSIIKGAGQIPVSRGSADAVSSLHAAIKAVNAGECVVIYPEGTLTRDPNLWPMTAKTGVARVALTTGCPVIPAAQWGPQAVIGPYEKVPHPFPRKTMHIWAGPPVDLDDLRGLPITATVLREATDRIMKRITDLLAEIRNEVPPSEPFDRRIALSQNKPMPQTDSSTGAVE